MNEENIWWYFYLSVLANLCQITSFNKEMNETSNNELSKKLDKIISQNEKILEILKK